MPNGWTRVLLPEDMGLSSVAFLRFFAQHAEMGIHSLAVVREEKVFAMAVKPWGEELPHTLFSLSKSFCSMAAGMAVDEGLLSYDDNVADVLKDSLPPGDDPTLNSVKLRHLLSMSSGLDPVSDQRSLRGKRDWARAVLGFQVLHEPGTHFHYNTLGTYLAGRMVDKVTGMSLRDYLMPRLFGPLEIPKPQWDCCPLGYNTAGFGLHLSCMDIAKTAQLLLSRGVWNGQRLLSEEYLDLATHKRVDNRNETTGENPSDWEVGYGFQFWMARHGRWRGDGMYGQVMMVDEANNLALAVTAGLNDMGAEMDALHTLMDDLLSLSPAKREEKAALKRLSQTLAFPEPPDDGGALYGEGSYETRDHKLLRLETPDEDTLRVFYKGRGQPWPLVFTMGRGGPHRGEFRTITPGERPQPYLGRFGVKQGVITAQALMPGAPYMLALDISRVGDGMRVSMKSVGSDNGQFQFKPAGR